MITFQKEGECLFENLRAQLSCAKDGLIRWKSRWGKEKVDQEKTALMPKRTGKRIRGNSLLRA